MATGFHPQTAQIFKFPFQPRVPVAGHPEMTKPVVDPRLASYAATTFGESWYHDAAIRESDPTLKS